MKHLAILIMTVIGCLVLVFALGSCASAPPEGAVTAEEQENPPAADFGDAWKNAAIRIKSGDTHELGADMARASFLCEWTDGQSAGTTYPQKFVDVNTGEEVSMELLWDHGGNIQEGVYDVLVEVDYPGPGEGWLRNIPIKGKHALDIIIDLHATKIEMSLEEIEQVVVFPEGTYADYESRNMLDEIPEDAEITRYDMYNPDCIAPSGVLDLRVTYPSGEVDWIEGYRLAPDSKVTELPKFGS